MSRRWIFLTILTLLLLIGSAIWLAAEARRQYRRDDALFAAVERNDVRATRILLQNGADSNTERTLFPISTNPWHSALTRLLPCFRTNADKADDEVRPEITRSTLQLAIDQHDSPAIVDALLARGADHFSPEFILAHYNPPIRWAFEKRRWDLVRRFGKMGANPNIGDGTCFPNTLLNDAAYAGDIQAVQALLDAGADPNIAHEQTALQNAIMGNHIAVVRLLIQRGADVNARDVWHKSVLQEAEAECPTMIPLLRKAGAKN